MKVEVKAENKLVYVTLASTLTFFNVGKRS